MNQEMFDDRNLTVEFSDYKKILAQLEKRLLVFGADEHTESGKHVKFYMTWNSSGLFRAFRRSSEREYLNAITKFQKFLIRRI